MEKGAPCHPSGLSEQLATREIDVNRVTRCAGRVARRWQTYFWLSTPLKEQHLRSRVIVDSALAVTAAHTTSTSSWKHEKGAQSLKVRTCMRPLSARIR